jgi:cardiolipin synthase
MEILVDGLAYKEALQKDLNLARERVYFQVLSFEADSVGEWLGAELLKRRDLDRRLIIDDYSFYIVNDVFLGRKATEKTQPHFDERIRTINLIERLKRDGVRVTITHPVCGLKYRLASRQHRKITVIDRTAYLGGINLCEHNFNWHDFMVRINDSDIVDDLAKDFLASEKGIMRGGIKAFKENQKILYFNGTHSLDVNHYLFDQFSKAKESLVLISPYLGFPFWNYLKQASSRGVRVKVLSPKTNNWKLYEKYTQAEALDSNFEIWSYPDMLHMKALFVDGKTLFLGSSNFEYFGLKLHQEILLESQNLKLVRDFRTLILEKSFEVSKQKKIAPMSIGMRIFVRLLFQMAMRFIHFVNICDFRNRSGFHHKNVSGTDEKI